MHDYVLSSSHAILYDRLANAYGHGGLLVVHCQLLVIRAELRSGIEATLRSQALGSHSEVTVSNVLFTGQTWSFKLTSRSTDIRTIKRGRLLSDEQLRPELFHIVGVFCDQLGVTWAEAGLVDINHPDSSDFDVQVKR